jgi:hypothetical protein
MLYLLRYLTFLHAADVLSLLRYLTYIHTCVCVCACVRVCVCVCEREREREYYSVVRPTVRTCFTCRQHALLVALLAGRIRLSPHESIRAS